MGKVLKGFNSIVKGILVVAIFLSIPKITFASNMDFVQFPQKSNVSVDKPWNVKFNLSLDNKTINNENVNVKDARGNKLKVSVTNGKDDKSIVIYPPVGGYIPGGSYSLELTNRVKSRGENNFSKLTKMNFITSEEYKDCTNYESVPNIKSIDILQKSILDNEKTSFKISSNYNAKAQYRIFLFDYSDEVFDNSNNSRYSNIPYIELTKGYTNATVATKPYVFEKTEGFKAGKYKLMVYVKGEGRKGINKDNNTDYDNYYTTYFKVLDSSITRTNPINSTITYKDYNKTFVNAVKVQYLKGVYSESTGWMKASESLLKYYMNPNNFLDNANKYLFLKLNYMEVSAGDLNTILKGNGVLEGKGEIFLKAAKDNDINPIYLVAHAFLETGNGTSQLSNGILVSSVNGNKVTPKKTYNMFGIKAYDDSPLKSGSEYAYSQGWFTVDQAILGGAKFIGNNYINKKGNRQDTLYKMRWDIDYNSYPHQYATDIGWAKKQVSRVKFQNLMSQCKTAKPVFEIPRFK